jgi:Protein of unknown function (DUF2637)
MRRSEPRRRMTEQEIRSIVDKFADIARVLIDADPNDKAEIFRQFGLRLTYPPGRQLVKAQIEAPHWYFKGVRGPRPTDWAWWRNCPDQVFCRWRCPVKATDGVIRWTTAGAVVGVAAVAAVASYEHAYALVRAHGEAGWTGRLVPLTVDGLIYASSMVMLDSARRRVPVPPLARWLLGLGIAATLAANVVHGLGQGPAGAVVAAWPAVALVGSYELLMMVIHNSQVPVDDTSETGHDADPLQEQAAELFAEELAADRVPSVRSIRARLHVGQLRAQRVRDYLAGLAEAG